MKKLLDHHSLEEVRGLSKDERCANKILVCEGKCSSETPLEVPPFEYRGPFSVTQLMRLLGRILHLATEDHVFVFDIVALDISDETLECAFRLVMLSVRAQPRCGLPYQNKLQFPEGKRSRGIRE